MANLQMAGAYIKVRESDDRFMFLFFSLILDCIHFCMMDYFSFRSCFSTKAFFSLFVHLYLRVTLDSLVPIC